MLKELKERIEQVKEKSIKGGVLTSESEFSEEMMDIRKDFVAIHGEMVLLKNYSSLNFAGIAYFTSFFSSMSNLGQSRALSPFMGRWCFSKIIVPQVLQVNCCFINSFST